MDTLNDFFQNNPFFLGLAITDADRSRLREIMEGEFLYPFLARIISASEEIIAIDPKLERQEILEQAARLIADDLGAVAASIRLFDPKSLKMLSYGSYGLADFSRDQAIPIKKSIAGKVVSENRAVVVSSILADPLYRGKKIATSKGLHSLLAVPLGIPSFISKSRDIRGSLQIYYREDNREFSNLEIIFAEMLARRVSYVLARKKIIDLKKLIDCQNRIVDKIFIKLSKREGIKLKDFFHAIMPELEEFLQTKSCSLFTISDDGSLIRLETAYPLHKSYHEDGYTFTIDHHPYFRYAVYGPPQFDDRPYERYEPGYILIKDPLRSELTTPGIRKFVKENVIHSILLVPLRIDDRARHILAIYATDQKLYFSEEEIELFTFFSKEIMKASRLEFLGDMIHDFKNPAIAVAGLAERARRLMDEKDLEPLREKVQSYMNIVAKEAARLQDIAVTISGEERKQNVDLAKIAAERFALNEEVILVEHLLIDSHLDGCHEPLPVFCSVFGLERVIDNLLNNATKAVPREGGRLVLRCFHDSTMAYLEIVNTGIIPAQKLAELKQGDAAGRGVNIIARFVRVHHGALTIESTNGQTAITLGLPLIAS